MSPILVRPVREQLEHDRVIRLLQAKYKRKFEVGINPGNEQTTPVGTGTAAWYPDLVLQSADKARKLLGVVEVETAESVNHLEAMSQWATFSKFRVPFHLYVPQSMIDPARRLCTDLQVSVAEVWMYNLLGDQMRFTLVQRAQGSEGKPRSSAGGERKAEKARPAPKAEKARPAVSATKASAAKASPSNAPAPKASSSKGEKPRPASTKTAAARPVRRAAPAVVPPRRKVAVPKAAARAKPAGRAREAAAKKTAKTYGSSRSQKRK